MRLYTNNTSIFFEKCFFTQPNRFHRVGEARSCLDIKRTYKTDVDQEYPINILGRNISIYCHKMDTDHPKEFLSLPVGEMENYSEFYSKR